MKLVLIFALVLFAFTFTFPRWADWNQNSRFDLVQAIVEERTFAIDSYRENTGDYAAVGGHFYSDKAPGLAFIGVPPFIAFKLIARSIPVQSLLASLEKNQTLVETLNPTGTGLNENKIYAMAGLTWVSFFTVAIPSVILSVLLFRVLACWLHSGTAIGLATWGWIFATPAVAYANLFVSHMLTAACLFSAYYLANTALSGAVSPTSPESKEPQPILHISGLRTNTRLSWLRLTAIGFLLGYAVISEYPALLVAIAIVVYIFAGSNLLRALVGVAAGAAPPLVLLAAYNWIVYGSPFSIGYTQSALFPEHFNSGLLGVTFPKLDALWGLTFSPYRGLFFVSPFLLFAIPGLYWMWQKLDLRHDVLLIVWCLVSQVLFLSATPLWDGGFAIGPRYLILVLPFVILPVGFAIERLWTQLVTRIAVCLLIALSAFVVWAESFGGTSFPQYDAYPLFDYSLPHILNGEFARNWAMAIHLPGLWSFLPWLVASLVLIFILSTPLLQHVYQNKTSESSAVSA